MEMDVEFQFARESHFDTDDAQDLDEHNRQRARHLLWCKYTPKHCGNHYRNWPFQAMHDDLLSVEKDFALQNFFHCQGFRRNCERRGRETEAADRYRRADLSATAICERR